MKIQVALSLNIPEPLTYSITGSEVEIQPGERVVVPVGGRLEVGWIVGMGSEYSGRIRAVVGRIRDDYRPGRRFVDFCLTAAGRFMVSPGRLLDASLSPRRRNRKQIVLEGGTREQSLAKLTPRILENRKKDFPLNFKYSARNIGDGGDERRFNAQSKGFSERLILAYDRGDGYGEWISGYRDKGLSALILTADNTSADHLAAMIPGAFAYHSSIGLASREERWARARQQEPVVAVGGQSALMLPVNNLGAILIEHPAAWVYRKPEWDAVNTLALARLRAAFFGVPLIQGDNVFPLPVYRRRSFVSVEDRRAEKSVSTRVFPIPSGAKGIPDEFVSRVSAHLDQGRRVLVLVNRKKGVDFLYCSTCGRTARCPGCRRPLKPGDQEKSASACSECHPSAEVWSTCADCGKEWSLVRDISIDSVRKVVGQQLSGEPPPVVTAETEGAVLARVADRSGHPIVLGTTFILRPEFLGAFDAVIYLKPESAFHFTEFDAAERIQAVVGRLREMVTPGGHVDLFSMFHFHYALTLLNNENQFLQREAKYRSWFHLPPFQERFKVVVKNRSRRGLGVAMREILRLAGENMIVSKTGIVARSPVRGFYIGEIELRGSNSLLRRTGINGKKNTTVGCI